MLAPRGLTLLFAALLWSSSLGSASADALRKIDRAASGGGGGRVSREGSGSSGGSSRSSSRGSSSRSSSSGGSSYYIDDDDDECGRYSDNLCVSDDSLAELAAIYTIGSPWSIPHLFDDPTLVGYAPYPFAGGPGVLRVAAHSTPEADASGVRAVALAVDAESGYMLEGVVPGSLAMRLQLPRRFEIDARVQLFSDLYEQPVALAAASTAHLSYRFAQGRRFDFRTGAGVRLFTLDVVRLGIDFMYAVDSYLARNIVWRVELHVGSLAKAVAVQARSTLGVTIGRTELYSGYDHTAFKGGGSDATLGGPIAGVRTWF